MARAPGGSHERADDGILPQERDGQEGAVALGEDRVAQAALGYAPGAAMSGT